MASGELSARECILCGVKLWDYHQPNKYKAMLISESEFTLIKSTVVYIAINFNTS